MFFAISKLVGFFVQPSNVLIAASAFGIVLRLTRFARVGERLLIGSSAVLAVCAFFPIGNWILLPLEQRFPPWNESRGHVDGIIVLGGAINPEISEAFPYPGINEAAERISVVGRLARTYPSARIIYAGIEAQAAIGLLEDFGVPRGRIEAEDRSRNTIENAIFAKEIAKPKPGERWLVVTSAFHMPRAIGVFRQNGFSVEACPTDWRVRSSADLFVPAATLSDGLRRLDLGVHEWAGIVTYRLTGKSSALFPAPAEGAISTKGS
jgi:uncharacterized SAM-binding protein YcdF (DUF218 family)